MEKFLSRFAAQETLPREVYKIAKYYYARAGRQDKAIELYQYLAKTWPQDDYALLSLKDEAISRIKRYQMVEAQEVIEILLKNFSEHKNLAQALNGIAKAYHQEQDDEKALEYYQYVLVNYPASKSTLEARMGTAIAYIGLNQDEQVDTDVDTLMTDFADHSYLSRAVFTIGEEYYNIAMRMDREGDSQVADENFFKALNIWQIIVDELSESNCAPQAHYFVAVCYKELGEYVKAVEYYTIMTTKYSHNNLAWSAQFQVGYIYQYFKAHDLVENEIADEETRTAYEKVLAKYPHCPAANAARDWLKYNPRKEK